MRAHSHRRPTYYVRVQIERCITFFFLGTKSKFLAPGQIHGRSYKIKVFPFIILLCFITIAFVPPISIIVYCVLLRRLLQSDTPTHIGIGILVVLFIVSLTPVPFALREGGNAWREVRAPAQAFLLFGGKEHPMPAVRISIQPRTCISDCYRSPSIFHFLTHCITLFVLRLWKNCKPKLQVIAVFADSRPLYSWHSVMKQLLESHAM